MHDLQSLNIEKVIVHHVGNPKNDEKLILSRKQLMLSSGNFENALKKFFSSSFRAEETFQFTHPTDLALNEIYQYTQAIFKDSEHFLQASEAIAKHLFDITEHPGIKSGDVFIAYFTDAILEDEMTDAIGIFKSENLSSFLKTHQDAHQINVELDSGIELGKVDKGALIFNTYQDSGLRVLVVDSSSGSGNNAKYWLDDFLQLEPARDKSYVTNSYLNMCREFSQEIEEKTDRVEKASFLAKSFDYFSKNEQFDSNEFANSVIDDDNLRDDFKSFRETFVTDNDLPQDISPIVKTVVKQQKKKFNEVIKLDGSIEIRLNGSSNLIKKGYDESRGQNYYQIFFDEEN